MNIAIFQEIYPVINREYILDIDKNIEIGIFKFLIDSLKLEEKKIIKGNRIIYKFNANEIKNLTYEKASPPLLHIIPHIIPYIKKL